MKNLPLQNIYNNFSDIYYSYRIGKELKIEKDISFKPFFYEENKEGNYIGYNGTKLTKIYTKSPHEIPKIRTDKSWEADVLYIKRWSIENINQIEKSETRYLLWDIEVKSKDEFPDQKEAKYPITFVTFYDNYDNSYKTFDYRDYNSEHELHEEICKYIKEISPDMLLAWNIDFDYNYCYNRILDFAKKISPIGMEQYKGQESATLPALISVIDLLALDYKLTLGKRESYKLDDVCLEELGDESWADHDFENDEKTKEKNIEDVKRMKKLIDKLDYINHYDEIRIETCCLWEDLPPERRGYNQWQSNNSKPIDMLFLKEAKKLGIVLPSKYQDIESEKYEGAYRQAFFKGALKGVYKYDVGSAYPMAIVDFCLDPANFIANSNDNTNALKINIIDREGKSTNTHNFIQNCNTILPTVVKKLLTMKNKLKEELKNDPNNKILETKYDTTKALINSLYGVLGNKYFRLYKKEVAETDTFLIRDLLHYVKDRIEEKGYKVVYLDTDSFFVDSEKNIANLLNKYVYQWAKEKYNKEVNIQFDCEGVFDKLFIVSLCRYIGYLRKPNGEIKTEIKGLQVKRRDATLFVKKFQEDLLNFVLDGHSKEEILDYIRNIVKSIKKEDIINIAQPCKLNKPRSDYKKQEIFFRGLDYSGLEPKIGEKIYWLPIIEKECDVTTFNKNMTENINKKIVNWEKVIESQVFNILVPIFEGMNWGKELLNLCEEFGIILNSQHRNTLLEVYEDKEDLKKYYGAREAKKRIKKQLTTL